MTSTAHFYDTFEDLDLTNPFNLSAALVASTYTFDATDASYSTDIEPDVATGSGYADIFNLNFTYVSASGGVQLYSITASGSPASFAAMTVTDYQYLIIYSSTDEPLICVDLGAPAALTGQGLAISDPIFSITQ